MLIHNSVLLQLLWANSGRGGKFPTGDGDFKGLAFPVENFFLFVDYAKNISR